MSGEHGVFGFVCYGNKDGPESVGKALEALNNMTFKEDDGTEVKLYVKEYVNKEKREQEKFQDMIRYKNSKKRCNLYVKNFPAEWKEEDIRNTFQ